MIFGRHFAANSVVHTEFIEVDGTSVELKASERYFSGGGAASDEAEVTLLCLFLGSEEPR